MAPHVLIPLAQGCEGLEAVTIIDDVVIDGNIITSKSAGTAMDFALCLVGVLLGK